VVVLALVVRARVPVAAVHQARDRDAERALTASATSCFWASPRFSSRRSAARLPFLSDALADDSDPSLKTLAEAIDNNLAEEASQFLTLTDTIQHGHTGDLNECRTLVSGLAPKVCDFWQSLPVEQRTPFADLDVITWVNRQGLQVWKWTAKSQVTPLIPQRYAALRRHPRETHVVAATRARAREPHQFTIEPLRSPTTSDMAFVFAVPYQDGGIRADAGPQRQAQSLVNPLLPPGYGFAIVAADGRVLFHATSR